jgi:pyruvate/2-oxoglutarate dehydrogenase complex dihydrolipoamide acyltransferase (E2) component
VTATGRDAETERGRAVQDAAPRRESAEGEEESGSGHMELTLTGDRREVEALSLEVRRLAREHGLKIWDMRLRPDPEPPEEGSGRGDSG